MNQPTAPYFGRSTADMLKVPHTYEPMGDATPIASATCRVCGGNALVEAHSEPTRTENDIERCYRMALTNPLAKDNPFLATTIAMADWIERGGK